MTKVSIVIPVHNAEPYLRQCMESLIGQTLQEIEILCVDDGSTDMSLDILRYYQARDSRIQIICHDTAKGCIVARKAGTMVATGEYILHLDPDDYLELDACELLYKKITKEKVDILQFNTQVVNCGNLPEEEIQNLYNLLHPYERRLEGKQILDEFCLKQSFSQNWLKLYRTSVCKQAFSEIKDQFLIMAEDYYAFFLIAYYAKSYLGWNSPPLHNYCIGRGVTGFSSVNLDKLRQLCSQVNVADNLESFCKEHNIWKRYAKAIENRRKCWLGDCVWAWMEKLPREFGTQGMEIIFEHWGVENTIAALANQYWDQRTKVAGKLSDLPRHPLKDRKIKTVAFYYWTMSVGGIERVISILSPMLEARGYRVVVITDQKPADTDFPLPDTVTRVTIQNWLTPTHHDISQRLADWKKILETYQIDVVLYQAWVSHMLLWDMLYLKSQNVPVVVHCHDAYSFCMATASNQFVESHYTLPLADALVTLSIADQAYYSVYHDNVYYIPNPISESLKLAEVSDGTEPSIVWVGRNSYEKQPEYVFPIMRYVAAQLPEAKLYMVGAFTDDRWKDMAKEYGVEDNIVFCGQTHDVGQYYQRASVFLSTSQFEGFPMVLLEAQAHGLPSVIFDMPNLMAAKPGRGVTVVETNDSFSAAYEIVKLLSNKEYWKQQSAQAQWGFQDLLSHDVCQDWVDLLTGKTRRMEASEAVVDLCNVFVENYYQGLLFTDKRIGEIYRNLPPVPPAPMVEHKGSYKIGCFITYIPRKIWGGIRCLNENGFGYTFRLFLTKVKNKLGKIFLGWDV